MKPLQYLSLFLLLCSSAVAQQNHFIYIQTENTQAFYVRIAGRLLSSSSTGYIIISKLQNGTYDLNIGFPRNEWPTQKLSVNVKDKDAGYLLKNFDANGWGLFNLQTMDIINSTVEKTLPSKENKSDGFADELADVVSTPSIKQTAVVQTKEDQKAITNQPEKNPGKEAETHVRTYPAAIRLSTTLDNTGRSAVYIDKDGNKTDTIRVFIPYSFVAEKSTNDKKVAPTDTIKEDKRSNKEVVEEMPRDKRSVDANPSTRSNINDAKPAEVSAKPGCVNNANDDDFLKLRKRMAAQKTEENMTVMAKKAFTAKCYTTNQVNNLSALFLTDSGRYIFFDAAYSHISDSENFAQLVTKLTDPYYINRFKAMVGN